MLHRRDVRPALTAGLSFGLLAFAAALSPRLASADDAPPPAPAPAPAKAAPPAPPPPAPPRPVPVERTPPAVFAPSPCMPCDPCRSPSGYRLRLTGHASRLSDEPSGPPGGVPSGQPEPIDWDVLDYGWAGGGSASFEAPAWCGWTARIGGTYWGRWDDSATEFGTLGATSTPGGTVNPSPRFDADLSSKATLWDADLTFWHPLCESCWRTEWGVGLRYVSFEETSSFSFPQANTFSTIDARADNSLLGLQLGIRTEGPISSSLDLGGELGVFGGWRHTKREVTVTGLAPGTGGTEKDDEFGGGLSAEVSLRWNCGCNWSIIGGYGVIVLFEQARAWQLADFSNTATFNLGPQSSAETVVAQRIFLGIQLDF